MLKLKDLIEVRGGTLRSRALKQKFGDEPAKIGDKIQAGKKTFEVLKPAKVTSLKKGDYFVIKKDTLPHVYQFNGISEDYYENDVAKYADIKDLLRKKNVKSIKDLDEDDDYGLHSTDLTNNEKGTWIYFYDGKWLWRDKPISLLLAKKV